ncbi:hypothetical protein NFI96_002635 [Prochilodus magdalenae]|nr:hypothetical protein NFI96_002635 [Prochilodus magdalenae]
MDQLLPPYGNGEELGCTSSPSSFKYSSTRPAIPEDTWRTSVQTLLCPGAQMSECWAGVASSLKMKFSIVEIKGLKDGYHCGYCGGSWGKVSYDRTAPLLRPSALQDMATGGSTYTIVEYFGGDGGHRCGYCKNEMGNFSHGLVVSLYLTDPTATITALQRAVVSSMSPPVSAAPSADGCTTQDYMHTDRYHDCP